MNNDYFKERTVIDSNGCWIWQLSIMSSGYGACKGSSAHRLSYLNHIGKIPEGMVVRHKCNNKKCCNPYHLMLGTQVDNYYDMSELQRKEMVAKKNIVVSMVDVNCHRCGKSFRLRKNVFNSRTNSKSKNLHCSKFCSGKASVGK